MVKKIMRLTESDLVRLVNKVIKEQYDDNDFEFNTHIRNEKGDSEYEHSDTLIFLKGKSSKQVKRAISSLSKNIKFLTLRDCEYADFSDVDLCEYPKLMMVTLDGTPNNLEETQDNCYEAFGDKQQYLFNYLDTLNY
jgi:hypothetical protein